MYMCKHIHVFNNTMHLMCYLLLLLAHFFDSIFFNKVMNGTFMGHLTAAAKLFPAEHSVL